MSEAAHVLWTDRARRKALKKIRNRNRKWSQQLYRNGCRGKIRYADAEEAEAARAEVWTRHRDRLEVYKCSFCPTWHLGHRRPQREAQEAKRRLNLIWRAIFLLENRMWWLRQQEQRSEGR